MKAIQPWIHLWSGALAVGAVLALASGVGAATFEVTKFDDDNGACTPDDCALREAVMAANALPGADRIEIPPGTFNLTIGSADSVDMNVPESGDLDIRDEVDLVGNGSVIVAATGDRVVEVVFTSATFSNVTLTGGQDLLDIGGCVRLLEANATFIDSSITNCFCDQVGGGIASFLSTATLISTTVNGNEANQAGGGIVTLLGGSMEIINSTISGNRATLVGGGIVHDSGTLLIRHSTIAHNEAPLATALFARSITNVQNSILEGTCTGLLPFSFGRNMAGPDLTNHCLLGSFLPDEIVVQELGLGPLANNGGPTMTHALLPTSPAIDAANPAFCEATDQRGVPRPQGAGCDIGAFERLANLIDVPALSTTGLLALATALALGGVVMTSRLSRRRR